MINPNQIAEELILITEQYGAEKELCIDIVNSVLTKFTDDNELIEDILIYINLY